MRSWREKSQMLANDQCSSGLTRTSDGQPLSVGANDANEPCVGAYVEQCKRMLIIDFKNNNYKKPERNKPQCGSVAR